MRSKSGERGWGEGGDEVRLADGALVTKFKTIQGRTRTGRKRKRKGGGGERERGLVLRREFHPAPGNGTSAAFIKADLGFLK